MMESKSGETTETQENAALSGEVQRDPSSPTTSAPELLTGAHVGVVIASRLQQSSHGNSTDSSNLTLLEKARRGRGTGPCNAVTKRIRST